MANKQLFNLDSMKSKISELTDELNQASEAYYNDKEIMTNKEFDAKFDELKHLEDETGFYLEDSPTHNVGAAAVDSLPKFKHTYLALSLDKTKDADELQKRFKEGVLDSCSSNDQVIIMWKEDGSTIQAYYNDGKLQHLVTRGNGEIGSDITHNAASISGIPLSIPEKGEVVVRGEALMSYADFNSVNDALPEGQQYKNPRNLAAASIQLLDPAETLNRHITVKAFNLVNWEHENKTATFEDRLLQLSSWGFNTVEYAKCSVDRLKEGISDMSSIVDEYPYPVDGLVVAMNNYAYSSKLAGTEHHPNIMQGYAFKWADECEETTLREIEWSPSRTGLLNPVAIFDPVELEGTTVSRASLHNLSEMYRILGPHPYEGERISVYKANKVIPVVEKGYYEEE